MSVSKRVFQNFPEKKFEKTSLLKLFEPKLACSFNLKCVEKIFNM